MVPASMIFASPPPINPRVDPEIVLVSPHQINHRRLVSMILLPFPQTIAEEVDALAIVLPLQAPIIESIELSWTWLYSPAQMMV